MDNLVVLFHRVLGGARVRAETFVLDAADGDVGTSCGSDDTRRDRGPNQMVRTLGVDLNSAGASTAAARSLSLPLGRTGPIGTDLHALHSLRRSRRIAAGRLNRTERTVLRRFTQPVWPQRAVRRVLGGRYAGRPLWYFRWHFAARATTARRRTGTSAGAANSDATRTHVNLRRRVVRRVRTVPVWQTAGGGHDRLSAGRIPRQIHRRNGRIQDGTAAAHVQILRSVLAALVR